MKSILLAACLLLPLLTPVARAQSALQDKLRETISLYGHRNWIVVADAAYPAQTSPGVETIHIGGNQVDAVKEVLAALAATKHVQPIIHLDAELKHLDEKLAPGVIAYRNGLKALLGSRHTEEEPHEDIIKKIDAAGQTFRVLILKTDCVVPYSSVFLQLDCGYWSVEKEKQLREAMAK